MSSFTRGSFVRKSDGGPVPARTATKASVPVLARPVNAAASTFHVPSRNVSLPGTRSWLNSQVLTSTGLTPFDQILGGGVPLGSIVLIKEDQNTKYYDFFSKLFIGTGVGFDHAVCCVSTDSQSRIKSYLSTLPRNVTMEGEDEEKGKETEKESKQNGDDGEVMKKEDDLMAKIEEAESQKGLQIAWQYHKYLNKHMDAASNLGQNSVSSVVGELRSGLSMSLAGEVVGSVGSIGGGGGVGDGKGSLANKKGSFVKAGAGTGVQVSPSSSSSSSTNRGYGTALCHQFDLTKAITPTFLSQSNITHIRMVSAEEEVINKESDATLASLPTMVAKFLREHSIATQASSSSEPPLPLKNVARLVLHSFGSPLWGLTERESGYREALSLLQTLRGVVTASQAVCYITLPAYLHSAWFVRSVEHLCDVVVHVQSFAGAGGDVSGSAFADHDGLLTLLKYPLLHSLIGQPPDTLEYLFKLRRRTLMIEKLSLPPELSRSEQSVPQQQLIDPLRPNNPDSVGCGSGSGTSNSKLDF